MGLAVLAEPRLLGRQTSTASPQRLWPAIHASTQVQSCARRAASVCQVAPPAGAWNREGRETRVAVGVE